MSQHLRSRLYSRYTTSYEDSKELIERTMVHEDAWQCTGQRFEAVEVIYIYYTVSICGVNW